VLKYHDFVYVYVLHFAYTDGNVRFECRVIRWLSARVRKVVELLALSIDSSISDHSE